jgi:ribosomal protein S18 acetylase RimI-like enzyme
MKDSAYILRTFIFPDDYHAVIQLWSTAGDGVHLGTSDTYEEIAKKMQRDPDLFLVVEKEGEIIGAVMGGFDGRRGLVYHLAVAHSERRNGIASALMTELEERLRSKGCRRAYLLVTPDNIEAQRYYEKRGWECMNILTYGKNLV